MFEIFFSGGWLMYPILACSIAAFAIVAERLWTLQSKKIIPQDLCSSLLHSLQNNQVNSQYIKKMKEESPLGAVLAKGLQYAGDDLDIMAAKMAEEGRHTTHSLESYLNTLGTIAATTPLIGLLGTVTGMIHVFSAITVSGPTDPEALAGGISVALLTTAFGLSVAIPSLMFHRHFNRKIDEIAVHMEQEAGKLMDYFKHYHMKKRQDTNLKNAAA